MFRFKFLHLFLLTNMVWYGQGVLTVHAQTWVAGQNVTLNINDYALIATNNAAVSMNLTTSTAGAAVTEVTNSSLFVKLSSIVPGSTRRKVTVRISSGSVPTATELKILPSSCTTTNSGGVLGTPNSAAINLSTVDQNLITGIGTCYTGTGSNDGYKMTFTWKNINPTTTYHQLASGTYNITVVFTLTAHDGNN